jgi:hypothetical protein
MDGVLEWWWSVGFLIPSMIQSLQYSITPISESTLQ